jgi:hypothetical protein
MYATFKHLDPHLPAARFTEFLADLLAEFPAWNGSKRTLLSRSLARFPRCEKTRVGATQAME